MCKCKKFDFDSEAKKILKHLKLTNGIKEKSLNELYNGGKSTMETKRKGVYAVYEGGELRKIGKATDKNGIFHRMSQYYRGKSDGLLYISLANRDEIKIKYFILDNIEDCWYAERKLQTIAYEDAEKMPWENKERN